MVPKNVIPGRIAEALRQFPPFSMLAPDDVATLAADATVRIKIKGDRVWEQGASPGEELLFLAQGRIEYVWNVDNRTELVDVRDVGDLLGLTALVEGKPFRVTANVVEDSVFYGLPWSRVRTLLEANDAARNYSRRHLFWATRVGGSVALASSAGNDILARSGSILQAHLDGARVIEPRPIDRLLTCSPKDTILAAATMMAAKRVPSILVADAEKRPLGIVTNSALVKHVVVGDTAKDRPVSEIMASPVLTVAAQSSATAAILLMLRERIGQVCVTQDGTVHTSALDVCTHKDLLAQSGHHPAGLLRELRDARSPARFRELCDDIEAIARSYLEAGVSGIFLGQICAELYDVLAQRLIALSCEELHKRGQQIPASGWAWINVGSDGRREQILRTDMDNAIVFAPTGSHTGDEALRTTLTGLASRVIERMVECGFSRCQGGVMASNPRWCRSTTEWIDELENVAGATTPDGNLRATVLYDLRFVSGDAGVVEPLRSAVFDTVGRNDALQRQLAEMIVAKSPPLNFFGKFVVERRGGREVEFDIKGRGLTPLRDAARILALKHGLRRHYSTGGRWNEIKESVPRLAEVAALARDCYDVLMRLRTLTGLRRGDAGRFLDPSTLTKLERAQLANVFDVVRMVQNSVRIEFGLDLHR
jgi:CBS domain-containing protein